MIDSFGIDGGQISVQVLPNEIWTLIFQNLEGEDLAAVAITTKSFTDLIKYVDSKLLISKLTPIADPMKNYCSVLKNGHH